MRLKESNNPGNQIQNTLYESLELYHTLLEISPDAVTLTDLKGTIIMVNQQSVAMHGFDNSGEMIGKNASHLILDSDRSRAENDSRKILEKGCIRNIEYTLLKKNGTPFSATISASTIKDKKSTPIAFLIVIRDLSEQKRIRDLLAESETRYRIVTEGALVGVYIIKDGKFQYVNNTLCRMFGYSQDELLSGMGPLDLTIPEDLSLVSKQIERRLKGETESVRYSFGGLDKNGKIIYCESLGRIMEIDGQKLIIGTLLDITEQRKIDLELKRRVEFEKLILNLATKFVNLATNEIERGINDALREIGEFCDADRSYIFLFFDNGLKVENTHEWCYAGIEPQIDRLKNLDVSAFPWIFKKLKNKETVYVPRVNELPPEAAAEKEEFEFEKIKTLLNAPMIFQGEVLGFLGFDFVRKERKLSKEIIILLRIAGELFANILKRRQMDKDLELLNKELLKTNIKLKQLALRDTHTGLYNHRYFEEVIESEFLRAKRQNSNLSAIMLDIDYFKSINEVYGHHFGDMLLKQLSQQLKKMVRKYDTVIRFGGEEFIIIFPATDRQVALILAQRLLDVVKLQEFGDKQHHVKLKLSVAVVSYPEDNIANSMDFVRIAEQILDKVKESGGDRVYSSLDVKKKKISTLPKQVTDNDVVLLRDKIEKLTKRTNQSLAESIFAFAKTIEIKDHYTGEHVEKTVHYAVKIAKALGLSKDETEDIRTAAILHDLGKIGISEKILSKTSKLTAQEYEQIKKHPQIGVDILRPIQLFHKILPLVLHHHERWDGKGYPHRLKAEQIPLGARVIAIADAYEALTAGRRYRKACSKEQAKQIISAEAGTQFDSKLVDVFVKILDKEKD